MNEHQYKVALRNEIVESQKTQAEFLKWKLLAVGAVVSISMGFTSSNGSINDIDSLKLLLCVIPLICVYTDFISLHIMIRIVTIGVYLRNINDGYEEFVFSFRERGIKLFFFEIVALHFSSIIFNLTLMGMTQVDSLVPTNVTIYFLLFGSIGIVLTILAWIIYTTKVKKLITYGGDTNSNI